MTSKLEQSIRTLGEKYGFHAIAIGINTLCSADSHWSVNVHWEGFSRSGNPCAHGFGSDIQEALNNALGRAADDRTPFADEIADQAIFDAAGDRAAHPRLTPINTTPASLAGG